MRFMRVVPDFDCFDIPANLAFFRYYMEFHKNKTAGFALLVLPHYKDYFDRHFDGDYYFL